MLVCSLDFSVFCPQATALCRFAGHTGMHDACALDPACRKPHAFCA